MAEADAMAEVMNLLEAEPVPAQTNVQPDIPALHEQLPIHVSPGKAKEAIGVQLTQDQVKRMEAKETGIGWVSKKVVKENMTANLSANVINYAKFTAVMAGSVALKRYLEDQKILRN